MKGCLAITKNGKYLARKSKQSIKDKNGFYWSDNPQTARTYLNFDSAIKWSSRVGGNVKLMKDGENDA